MEEKISIIKEYVPKQFASQLEDAIKLSREFYGSTKRLNGQSYFEHSLDVAIGTAELGLDTASIIAALFHNIHINFHDDEWNSKIAEIENDIAKDVANILKEIQRINIISKRKQSDYPGLVRYILGHTGDLRPVLVQLVNELEDAKSFDTLETSDLNRNAQLIFNIWSPLAEYLHLNFIKKQLEDNAFRQSKPKDYQFLKEVLESRNYTLTTLERIKHDLADHVSNEFKYVPKAYGRIKSMSSIYNKYERQIKKQKGSGFDEILDLLAYTIVVNTEDECYLTLMLLEEKYTVCPNSTDDYIKHKKPNGYSGIHVSLTERESNVSFEVQIQTPEINWTNTYGTASHIAYKMANSQPISAGNNYKWVEELHNGIEKHRNLAKQEFSTPINFTAFDENIFVFTPKQELKELGKDYTVLDFAFHIHTDIGHQAVAAKINGKPGKLSSTLKTNDVVEIITDRNKKRQSRDWIDIVKSQATKKYIEKSHQIEI